jgi:integrase
MVKGFSGWPPFWPLEEFCYFSNHFSNRCDRCVVMTKKRGNGEGTIYQRSSDGMWLGVLYVTEDASGKRRRKYVTAKSRSEVVKKFKLLQRQIDEGLTAPDESVTVEMLFIRWRDDVLRHQVSPNTVDNYMTVATQHIFPTLGMKKLSQLTTNDVDRLISIKMKGDLAVSSVKRIRSVLAQAVDQAMRWGWVNRNVATLARSPRMPRQEGRTLTPEQAQHFLVSLQGHRLQALFSLMLSTGLRRGEALGLRWEDLDEDKCLLHVRRQLLRQKGVLMTTDTKTFQSRRSVNLPSQMLALLQDHRTRQEAERNSERGSWTESGFIFTSVVGTPFDPRNLLREFKKVCEDAGLGDWHPHELRHSAASLMLASGVKLQVVSEVLGHASIRMTADVYGHVLDPDRQSAADAMNNALWNGN